MKLYCCKCEKDIDARLTDGEEIYPHRKDLYCLPFWICDKCKSYVGCHYKTADRTRPLGVIGSKEIMEIRKKIHSIIDPIWKSKKQLRKTVYKKISDALGYEFHSAEIRSIGEANNVCSVIAKLWSEK